jgi:hypothetical protein
MGIGSGPQDRQTASHDDADDQTRPAQQPSEHRLGQETAHREAAWKDSPMQSFIVEATNRPGELARVANTIAERGINIEAFSLGYGTHGALAFMGHDEKGLKSALDAEGIAFKEVPLLTIWLEDKPGTVAKAASRLADAGVNIEFFAPVEYKADRRATVAIGVDNITAAKTALSDQLVDWMIPETALVGSATR